MPGALNANNQCPVNFIVSKKWTRFQSKKKFQNTLGFKYSSWTNSSEDRPRTLFYIFGVF